MFYFFYKINPHNNLFKCCCFYCLNFCFYKTTLFFLVGSYIIRYNPAFHREVDEWFKSHAWKACIRE